VFVAPSGQLALVYRDGDCAFRHKNECLRLQLLDDIYGYYGPSIRLRFPEDDNEHYFWEDPKCFTFRGQTMLSGTFVNLDPQSVPEGWPYGFSSAIFLCCINDKGEVWDYRLLRIPENPLSIEKNWVFFEQGDRLYCTYQLWNSCHGTREVNLTTGFANPAYYSYFDEFGWTDKYGLIRTTSQTVEHRELWWAAHHSRRIINPPHECFTKFQYNMGFYGFEPRPPFTIRRFSPEPVYGGERFQLGRWFPADTPCTVFPSGLVRWKDKVVMTAGIADKTIHIVEFAPDELWDLTQ
jgi:hypothetical protein